MEALAPLTGEPLARMPFASSIVLTLADTDSKAAKPYLVIVGHMLSTPSAFVSLWCVCEGATAAVAGAHIPIACSPIRLWRMSD
jgi:hypothetical protein